MPFKKGESGNPGGRPKELSELKELARAHTAAAIGRLVYWMRSDNARASVAASEILLNRAWGKAEAKVELDAVHRYVARVPAKAADSDEWLRDYAPPITH